MTAGTAGRTAIVRGASRGIGLAIAAASWITGETLVMDGGQNFGSPLVAEAIKQSV
jgi:NAD(P)-dependent dehydrogenase (short-subunit alcohol dehydrogenase family)